MSIIPSHWNLCKLGDVIRLKNGFAFKSNDYTEDGIPLIRISDINDNKVTVDSAVRIPREKANADFYIESGDLLIAMSGATTGKTGVYNGRAPILQNQRVGNFKIIDENIVDKRYRNYYVTSLRKDIEKAAYGGAQPNISSKRIESFDFPLAPLDQQKLIVSEIGKQFSRLDEAVAALKRVRASLKRYKASVLKAAVEGKLTEEWRKQNPNVEPADKLLERIKKERSLRGAERRSKLRGKEEIASPLARNDNLPELPKGWVWATWEMILAQEEGAFRRGPFGSTLKKSMFVESGYKVYEQYCPINDDPSFARYFITEKKYKEMEQFVVKSRDFLISCSGTMGRITQVPDEYDKGVINQALLRVRINNNIINGVFFKMLFISPYFQKQIFDNSTGSAIQNVKGVNDLKAIPLPLPPLEEQKAIIEEIDRRMSVIHEIDKEIETNLKRAERLRQAILKTAFSGRLVTQVKKI